MDGTRGITLLELLVVMAIVAVVLGLAVPMASSFAQGARLTSVAHVFLSQLHLARSEAIKRNGHVVLCKSADAATCSEAGGWEQGWIVFHDRNNDGLRDGSESVVQQVAALPAGVRLVGNMPVSRYVSFAGTGTTRTAGGAFQAGTVTACLRSTGATEGRKIVINAVGRPRLARVAMPACD